MDRDPGAGIASFERAVEDALRACDHKQLTAVLLGGLPMLGSTVTERLARQVLDRMPHDVHAWWNAPCDCHH